MKTPVPQRRRHKIELVSLCPRLDEGSESKKGRDAIQMFDDSNPESILGATPTETGGDTSPRGDGLKLIDRSSVYACKARVLVVPAA